MPDNVALLQRSKPNTEFDVRAFVDEGRAALRLPGVAVTFADGQQRETHYTGHYEEGSARPIDDDTLFPIGCLAKVVTAILVLRLCERGELDLNTPLVECLARESQLRTTIGRTTALGHVLAHTSAIYGSLDYQSLDDRGKDPLGAEAPLFETTVRQSGEPGLLFSYSHTAYACAALALEAVTQRSWLSMARELFAEVGGRLTDEPHGRTPRGHVWLGPHQPPRRLEPPIEQRRYDAGVTATGDLIYTDSKSLASLGLALLTRRELSGAEPILSDRSLELLRHAAWRPKYGGSGYFGVGLKQFARGCYGHRGWIDGQHSFLLICPERRRVLAFCTNVGNDLLARRLMQVLTGREFDLGLWVDAPGRTIPKQDDCIGRFVLGDHFVDIASRGARLTFCARPNTAPDAGGPGAVTLFPVAPNVFVGPCPFACLPGGRPSVMVEFINDETRPECRWLRVNDLVYERLGP